MPDAGIYPHGRKWPSVVLEVGYSETYEALLQDADLLLEGSEGRIGVVIIVKLQRLALEEESISHGFMETHTWDPVNVGEAWFSIGEFSFQRSCING